MYESTRGDSRCCQKKTNPHTHSKPTSNANPRLGSLRTLKMLQLTSTYLLQLQLCLLCVSPCPTRIHCLMHRRHHAGISTSAAARLYVSLNAWQPLIERLSSPHGKASCRILVLPPGVGGRVPPTEPARTLQDIGQVAIAKDGRAGCTPGSHRGLMPPRARLRRVSPSASPRRSPAHRPAAAADL